MLRRFQGSAADVDDNYICFGTTDKTDCTTDTDKYMYRIIGVAINDDSRYDTDTKIGQIKIQKKEALEDAMKWWEDYNNKDITWIIGEVEI